MTNVPIAQAKDRLSDYVAQAMAGEEVILTRHGKATVRLVPVDADRRARQRAAIRDWFDLGRELREAGGGIDAEDLQRWLDEERRFA